jgi:acyl-coenzyme A synthetase/AMP-(fatty) acid ligase
MMEILEFAGKARSTSKLPKRIVYVPAIPRDPSGKLDRRYLRDDRVGLGVNSELTNNVRTVSGQAHHS